MWGLGCRVWGLGFGVKGVGGLSGGRFEVEGLGRYSCSRAATMGPSFGSIVIHITLIFYKR